MDYGTNGNIKIKWIMGPMGTSKKNEIMGPPGKCTI
jgi:hypothetical protein